MPIDVILPKVDMDMEAGTIETWRVAEGDVVGEGDILFEISTSKAVMEVDAPAAGIVREITGRTGEPIAVGTVVARIYRQGEALAAAAAPAAAAVAVAAPSPAPAPAAAAPVTGGTAGLRATPLARRLARENGLDLARIAGSGPKGRVCEHDVTAALEARASAPCPAPAMARPAAPVPASLPSEDEYRPFGPVRRVIAQRLAESMRSAPHFYLTAQIEMTALIALTKRLGPRIEAKAGVRPSLTIVLARIVGRVLADHPMINASVEGEGARLHAGAHIGIAMERDGDLVVPVLRDVGTRSLVEIARDFARLRKAVRERSIQPADMRGGTFTISNLGMYGVDSFTAIINPPESAILAVGRTLDTPVGRDGQVVLRPMATFSLSSDHRIVDGVTAARFMSDLRDALENPEILI
jgi:pyruvate dehydrogenase E2 component (dihydrolipoamide acetyltransferase)